MAHILVQRILRRFLALGAVAGLVLLSGCEHDYPHPTDPTMDLVTGCFQSVNSSGEPYLLVACLNQSELDSLKTYQPEGQVAKQVRRLAAEYEDAVTHRPGSARHPTLNLQTGCFTGTGSTWEFLQRKVCLRDGTAFGQVVSPRVQRKVDLVEMAYFGQQTADLAARRPYPASSPNDSIAIPFIF